MQNTQCFNAVHICRLVEHNMDSHHKTTTKTFSRITMHKYIIAH